METSTQKHVSLFTYYFVFVVPVHQHFALIQYISVQRISTKQSNLDILHVDISLWLTDKILPLPNTENINTVNFFVFVANIGSKHISIDQQYFYNEPKSDVKIYSICMTTSYHSNDINHLCVLQTGTTLLLQLTLNIINH